MKSRIRSGISPGEDNIRFVLVAPIENFHLFPGQANSNGSEEKQRAHPSSKWHMEMRKYRVPLVNVAQQVQ